MDSRAPAAPSTAAGPRLRGFGWLYRLEGWLGRQQFAWLNNSPFWLPAVRRKLVARHRARVDLTIKASEAEMARGALERRGWECTTTSAFEDPSLSRLVFTVPIRSRGSGASAALAQELTVTLADARVRDVHHCVVDPAHPGYASLPEWRPRRAPSSQGDGEDRASRSRKRAPVQARAFGAPDAVDGGAALGRTIGQPDLDAECVGTLTDRLHGAVVALRRAVEEDVTRVVVPPPP